jgi:hypothetical protein
MRFLKLMIVVIAVCSVSILSLSLPTGSSASPVAADYMDIPPGFDFPADQAILLGYRDTNNVSAMRNHAWMVFAGLTQKTPGGEAVFETWFSGPEVFNPGPSPQGVRRIQRRFQTPRQFRRPGASPQAIGASLLSFTLFNKTTRDHIRTNELNKQRKLTSLRDTFKANGTPTEKRDVTDFPAPAVSLKLVWWLVKQTGKTGMPIWDAEPTRPDASGNDNTTWKRVVAVDPTRTTIPSGETADVRYPSTQLRRNSLVVPLENFYHFQITANEIAAVRAVLGGSAQIGDYAALVAMHVTTKEIPDWVWATFWWHDQPNDGPFSADRPGQVSGVWKNYRMDVAYSSDTPTEGDGSPNVCYNPWLEARFPNGMVSNCMACHQRAVWPQVGFLPIVRGGLAKNDLFYKTNDRMRLDFLWSVALESQ